MPPADQRHTWWRYKFFKINVDADQAHVNDVLNREGEQGWELVAVADCPGGQAVHWQSFYFKRRG
jgi:Domain of unknown function (DUF4177)